MWRSIKSNKFECMQLNIYSLQRLLGQGGAWMNSWDKHAGMWKIFKQMTQHVRCEMKSGDEMKRWWWWWRWRWWWWLVVMMLFLWLPASSRHVRPFRSLNTNKTPNNTFQVAQLFRVMNRFHSENRPCCLKNSENRPLIGGCRGCHYINFGQVCSCVQWDWKESMKVEHDYILDVVWSAFFMSLKPQWNPFLIDFMIQLLKIENKNSKHMLFHLFLFHGRVISTPAWSKPFVSESQKEPPLVAASYLEGHPR